MHELAEVIEEVFAKPLAYIILILLVFTLLSLLAKNNWSIKEVWKLL